MEQTELLEKLNAFTRRTHALDEVYLFDVILCDNEIDRDGDCFSDAALAELQKRFVGVTGIFDHNPSAAAQNARIFSTELRSDPRRKTRYGAVYQYLCANAYMVRTDGNKDLIREIEGGIKKEVSISCAVSVQQCSVCGANLLRKPCGHIKGHSYGGAPCHTVLDGITDVYEWSFVAVPAQRAAGVTKTRGGLHCDPEKDALRQRLFAVTETLESMTDRMRREVVRLCYKGGETACAKALADSALHLDAESLIALRDSLESGLAAAEPAQISETGQAQDGVSAYRL